MISISNNFNQLLIALFFKSREQKKKDTRIFTNYRLNFEVQQSHLWFILQLSGAEYEAQIWNKWRKTTLNPTLWPHDVVFACEQYPKLMVAILQRVKHKHWPHIGLVKTNWSFLLKREVIISTWTSSCVSQKQHTVLLCRQLLWTSLNKLTTGCR